MRAGIAGAGIIGRLLAHALQKVGWHVTLFDHNSERSCSTVAAGLLTQFSELEKNDQIIYQLGNDAIFSHWPRVLADIGEEIYFRQNGSLVVSHSRDHAELRRFCSILSNKLPQNESMQLLNREKIVELEPELAAFDHGFYFANEAHLDAQAVFAGLGHYLQGVRWIQNAFVDCVRAGEIVCQDAVEKFDIAFDCRGLGAKAHFNELRPLRGELVWLHAPGVLLSRPVRLLHPRYCLYVVPRPGGRYLIGATEIESSDCSEISVRSILELLTAAYTIHSGFSEARVLQTATHCRPTLPDNLPKIIYADGFLAVNGLYRHGYLIAPSLVADIMHWLDRDIASVKYSQLWEKIA